MNLRVFLISQPKGEALAELKDNLHPGIQISSGKQTPTPADYHILVAGRPTPEQLEASPNLHTLIIPWAGVPEETRDMLRDYPNIAVHNLHYNAASTGESALTLMLAAAKLTIPFDRKLRAHDWRGRYQPNPAVLLKGKTILILGYGSIGQHVARVCQALGMRILAIRKNHPENTSPDSLAEIHPREALHKLLPRAQILMITLPLTENTKGIIAKKELDLLPPNAILVNVGRGLIVDQAALFNALKDKKLHAAGLDVWYNYPADESARAHTPPADYPFHELDNVVMSPHRAGGSNESEILRMRHLATLLNTAARAEPLPNKVDLKAGY